ncbi:MAG: hypothetical protein HC796_09815 [Synechococcaceae cyanobacterium RL_1_2]|nr:hypothetical protein [Synechococcaceae cyanobacterium RL_1_2]
MTDYPQLNPRQLLELFLAQKYDLLSDRFIQLWQYFERVTYLQLDPNSQYFIDALVKHFLYVFTQPDYVLSDRHVEQFLRLNPTISNVVALSCFKTTDGHLQLLKAQPKNFAKFLTLCSARNQVKLNYDVLFEASADHACLWYSIFFETYRCAVATKLGLENLKEHLAYDHPALNKFHNPAILYAASLQIDSHNDRLLKQKINQSLSQAAQADKRLKINNEPHPNKIAIISCFWYPGHPHYEQFHSFVDGLVPHYDLTLVTLGALRPDLDTTPFDRILNLKIINGQLELTPLLSNNFMVIYYPDGAGLSEYIALINLRLAPIQIMGLGYPSSTWGSQIDYVISGGKVEPKQNPESNYAERLVLLPNYGVINRAIAAPTATLPPPQDREKLIITCPWSSDQFNYPWLLFLTKIVKDLSQPIKFRFLIDTQTQEIPLGKNYYLPLTQAIEEVFGSDTTEIIPHQQDETYFSLFAAGGSNPRFLSLQ